MKLIFVYNVNSGLWNSAFGSAHKVLSPSTYKCNLCSLTYGAFKENIIWKQFRESTNVEMDFYHLNEFKKAFPKLNLDKFQFPVVLKSIGDKIEALLTKKTLDDIKEVDELIGVLRKNIPENE
ncbi:MAG: GTPase [Flavobacteriaceae bacterium]|nr:GTPase [Flavobacteriaceae bacterium]